MIFPYYSTLPGRGDYGPPEDDDMSDFELDYEPDDFGNEMDEEENDGQA